MKDVGYSRHMLCLQGMHVRTRLVMVIAEFPASRPPTESASRLIAADA